MPAAWFAARRQAKRRLGALAVLAAQAAALGGIALALVSGAQRSSGVVGRYLAAGVRFDDGVSAEGLTKAQIAAVPGVIRVDPQGYIPFARPATGTAPLIAVNANLFDFRTVRDPRIQVLAGRLPDGRDPMEVVVNRPLTNTLGVGVGSLLRLRALAPEQGVEAARGVDDVRGPWYSFRVTGIVRTPEEIAGDRTAGSISSARATRLAMAVDESFRTAHRGEYLEWVGFNVRLRAGRAGVPAFEAALRRAVPAVHVDFEPDDPGLLRSASYRAPVSVETAALLALGAAAGLLVLLSTALLLRVEQRAHDDEARTLAALGATTSWLRAVAVGRVALAALAAGGGAWLLAVALSDRFPIGTGRQLELDPGRRSGGLLVGAGALVLALATLAFAAVLPPISGPRRRSSPSARSTGAAQRIGELGAPLAVVLGVRLATREGDGRAAGTTVQAVVGAVALLATAGGLVTWSTGVAGAYERGDRHGWPWDVAVGNSNFTLAPETLARLRRDARLPQSTAIAYAQAHIAGESAELLTFDPAGTAPPTVLSGRLPRGGQEIALGPLTMRRHDLRIGSQVRFDVSGGPFDQGHVTQATELTVVGVALVPVFGESDFGDVALVDAAAVRRVGGDPSPSYVVARVDRRLDRRATVAALDRDYTEDQLSDSVGARVVNLWNVRRIPLVGAALAVMIAALLIAVVLAAACRSHRRNFAVLGALGMEGRQRRAVVRWASASVLAVVIFAGVPAGLLLGHRWWQGVASGLGVPDGGVDPALPVLVSVAALAAAVWVSSLVAAGRLDRCAADDGAAVLRAE